MTAQNAARPTFDSPSAEEQERRTQVVNVARHFVLDGSHLEQPVKWSLGAQPADPDTTPVFGTTKSAINQMLRVYPTAGTNATTTARHSTVNIIRGRMRSNLRVSLDTNVETPTPEAVAFGLAMKWFHEAVQWAERQLAASDQFADEYASDQLAEAEALVLEAIEAV